MLDYSNLYMKYSKDFTKYEICTDATNESLFNVSLLAATHRLNLRLGVYNNIDASIEKTQSKIDRLNSKLMKMNRRLEILKDAKSLGYGSNDTQKQENKTK